MTTDPSISHIKAFKLQQNCQLLLKYTQHLQKKYKYTAKILPCTHQNEPLTNQKISAGEGVISSHSSSNSIWPFTIQSKFSAFLKRPATLYNTQ